MTRELCLSHENLNSLETETRPAFTRSWSSWAGLWAREDAAGAHSAECLTFAGPLPPLLPPASRAPWSGRWASGREVCVHVQGSGWAWRDARRLSALNSERRPVSWRVGTA